MCEKITVSLDLSGMMMICIFLMIDHFIHCYAPTILRHLLHYEFFHTFHNVYTVEYDT